MDLETCLLCLKIKSEVNDIIPVDSVQWKSENIKYLIEKHLWPMDTTQLFAWLCTSCWRELGDFHKFYVRIEKAQAKYGKIMKTDEVKGPLENQQIFKEELIETEILIDPPLSREGEVENPLIKAEKENKDEAHKQKGRRPRQPKDCLLNISESKDPLKKRRIKAIKKNELKSNEILKSSSFLDGTTLFEKSKEKLVKHEMETSEVSKVPNIMSETINDYDSETEYEEIDDKKHFETPKRKRKNPDEKTGREHDRIIAEYFKIFCSLCQTPMENFIALRKHFREEHSKRGFVICCKKKIFTRPILVDHINFHLDPNYFKCKYCEKVYSDRCTLESHTKVHENGQQNRNHTCDTCGKSFVCSSQLNNHKVIHAPDYEKKFSCNECGKVFRTLYSLNYHIQAIHHNKYVKICDICGKTMRCRNSFKLHMEKHDNKSGTSFNCDICGLILSDRCGLRRHKKSQHPVGGKKEYTCHICPKVSPNLRALRTHVRFAHETGYIHKCTMCDKAFKRPETLKEHIATHTGTPLYTCSWCPKTFISNGNMYNHRKKSHPKEYEEAQRHKYGGIISTKFKTQI